MHLNKFHAVIDKLKTCLYLSTIGSAANFDNLHISIHTKKLSFLQCRTCHGNGV